MKKVFGKPESLLDTETMYCAGCGHGVIHRLVAECVDELGLRQITIGIAPVGCSVFADQYFNFDMLGPAHGRPPAAATGMKRAKPDCHIISYQGDGDLAAIGTAEIVHAAARGEKISVIFVHNGIYGMTGGQLAPTTLPGQRSTTTPLGRNPEIAGYPLRVVEMLATMDGAAYLARTSVHNVKNIIKTKKAIKKAFEVQQAGLGFSLVEILSACPTNWRMTTKDSLKWIEEKMIPYYGLKVTKDVTAKK